MGGFGLTFLLQKAAGGNETAAGVLETSAKLRVVSIIDRGLGGK